jgi:hypothetical protein
MMKEQVLPVTANHHYFIGQSANGKVKGSRRTHTASGANNRNLHQLASF